jgi:hypothetical protein
MNRRFVFILQLLVMCITNTSIHAQWRAQVNLMFKSKTDNEKYVDCAKFKLVNQLGFYKNYEVYNASNYAFVLDSGKYALIFPKDSIHLDTFNLYINDRRPQNVNVYTIDANDTFKLKLSDSLKVGEKMVLNYHTSGCFHYGGDMLVLERTAEHYLITRDGKEKILNEVDLKALKTFESKLSLMLYRGCTTEEDYTLSFRNTNYYIVDGSCRIDAYQEFITAIFGAKAYWDSISNE